MIQNVQIIIEQFDNGITLLWKDEDGEFDDGKIVANDDQRNSEIGSQIWDDIRSIMDTTACNKVIMRINYKPMEE